MPDVTHEATGTVYGWKREKVFTAKDEGTVRGKLELHIHCARSHNSCGVEREVNTLTALFPCLHARKALFGYSR